MDKIIIHKKQKKSYVIKIESEAKANKKKRL